MGYPESNGGVILRMKPATELFFDFQAKTR